jgi:uncharacterized protein with FMN-binding domain
MRRVLLVLLVLLGAAALIYAFWGRPYLNSMQEALEALSDLPVDVLEVSDSDDGIYQGSFAAGPIAVVLQVRMAEHRIDEITIGKHEQGRGKAAEKITEQIISQQSLQVDTIAGATYSSQVIVHAVQDALHQAAR